MWWGSVVEDSGHRNGSQESSLVSKSVFMGAGEAGLDPRGLCDPRKLLCTE